jgi:hypothetical protein
MRITVSQFQAINEVSESPLDDFQKSIEFVRILTGKSEFEVQTMSVRKFNRICSMLVKLMDKWNSDTLDKRPKDKIFINGKAYKINYDIHQVTTGKYAEVMEFSKEPVKNLHKIIASMVVPLKLTWKGYKEVPYKAEDHELIANEMLNANYDDVYQSMVFFYALLASLINNLSTSGLTMDQQIAVRSLRLSVKFGGGFIKPKWYQSLTV